MRQTLAIASAALCLATALPAPVAAQTGRAAFYALGEADRITLQAALKEAGLYASAIDGLWGPGTSRAVSAARASLAWPTFARSARAAGIGDEMTILLAYARTPNLRASLPGWRTP